MDNPRDAALIEMWHLSPVHPLRHYWKRYNGYTRATRQGYKVFHLQLNEKHCRYIRLISALAPVILAEIHPQFVV